MWLLYPVMHYFLNNLILLFSRTKKRKTEININTFLLLGFIMDVKQLSLVKIFVAVLLSSVAEAITTQVDNLVLPLIMYIVLALWCVVILIY